MSAGPKELRGGRYVLLGKLGEGSQGETYEALDAARAPQPHKTVALQDEWSRYVRRATTAKAPPAGARTVAIKRFAVGRAKAWKDVELAEREATTLASLDHPRLPKYIEHFEEDGALYLVMERIEGESLAAPRRGQRAAWSAADVARMIEDIGDALRYLHGRAPPVVHRDIKPGNILRRPDGSFALVDFGAVRDRLRPAGGSTVVGTFGYMAPEQFQGRASARSDLYGLAATALAMLTGEEPEALPHEGLGIDVARAVPSGTPAPLARALAAMLTPDPDRRVGSIDEALGILRGAPGDEPAPDRRERRPRARRGGTRQRRRRARGRRVPLAARLFAQLGLLIAMIAVSAVVGVLIPLVLFALSPLFGGRGRALGRAAGACRRATQRSVAALGRASSRLSETKDEGNKARVRVAAEPERIRAEVPPASAAEDAWYDEDEPAADRRGRRRARDPSRRR